MSLRKPDSKFFNSQTTYPTRTNNKKIKACQLWENMRQRVEDGYFHIKYPTYKSVTVCDEWLDYQNFASWFEGQCLKDLYQEGWQLDKDILSKDVKIYSPETCVFIPKDLNCVLLGSVGKDQYGVTHKGNRYFARVRNNVRVVSKSCLSLEEAFTFYKVEKEKYVKSLIESYKDCVDKRVYDYFINWEVKRTSESNN